MPFNYKSEIERYRRYYQNIGEVVRRPKQQAYTTAIFSFLAVSLFGWYAIRPTLQTILFLQREIADNKVVSQQMEDKIGKLIDAQATYQRTKSSLPLLTQALPENSEAVGVVSQLRNLGSVSQASISAISVAAVPLIAGSASPAAVIKTPLQAGGTSSRLTVLPNRKILEVPITVVARGTYGNIQSFIDGIVQMRRIISVDSISLVPETDLSKIGSITGDIPLRVTLKLTAYYLE